jgi:hypothetical protein
MRITLPFISFSKERMLAPPDLSRGEDASPLLWKRIWVPGTTYLLHSFINFCGAEIESRLTHAK